MYEVDVEKGKYTFINDNGIVSIKRFGEEWQENVGGKALLCLLHHVEKLETELKHIKEHGESEEDKLNKGKVICHETFDKTIIMGAMNEYALCHGKRIHEDGTHSLVTYDTQVEEECLFLTLDFLDDHRTPKFYVTRILDNDLEPHDTIEKAVEDFVARLVKENNLDEAFVRSGFGEGFFN